MLGKQSTYISIIFLNSLLWACGGNDAPEPSGPIDGPTTNNSYIISDTFEGENYMVVASGEQGFIGAFKAELSDGTPVQLSELPQAWPTVLLDETGTAYDFLGKAISGEREGEKLVSMNTQLGYYFSLNAYYPSVIYPNQVIERPIVDKSTSAWSIDPSFVFRATFPDAIQALNSPAFVSVDFKDAIDENFFLDPEERVLVIRNGNEIKVYPHRVLDWHEIVNDQILDDKIVVSYCPLTGTGSVWSAQIGSANASFGVSGLLYNNNLILFDRATSSLWSQIGKEAINGTLKDQPAQEYAYEDLKWKAVVPLVTDYNVKVMSLETGLGYDYDIYPYGNYKNDQDRLNLPVSYRDKKIPGKEIVLGVIVNKKAKIYRF